MFLYDNNDMKIAFIGGGYSSIVSSILLKRKYHDLDIFIFEANAIILKKLKATGNGRCNINNLSDALGNYNNDKVSILLNNYPLDKQLEALESLNIITTSLDNGCIYPFSMSSDNVCRILINNINQLNINVKYNTLIKDYYFKDNNIILIDINNNKYIFDKVVFANGSIASPNLGCNYSLLDIFKNHGYKVNDFTSGLCPIKVKENVKSLFGVRFKCNVKILLENKILFNENGEVVFKKDGISGIVIFNASVKTFNTDKPYKIVLDIINQDITSDRLFNMYKLGSDPLYSLINNKLITYIYNLLKIKDINKITKKDCQNIIDTLHHLTFTYNGKYPFNEAQICLGGVDIENINLNNMSSKIENNVYFIGEILSIKGVSGGFNLKFALISALELVNNFKIR